MISVKGSICIDWWSFHGEMNLMERSLGEAISVSNDVIFHVIFIVERFWFINNHVEEKQQIRKECLSIIQRNQITMFLLGLSAEIQLDYLGYIAKQSNSKWYVCLRLRQFDERLIDGYQTSFLFRLLINNRRLINWGVENKMTFHRINRLPLGLSIDKTNFNNRTIGRILKSIQILLFESFQYQLTCRWWSR